MLFCLAFWATCIYWVNCPKLMLSVCVCVRELVYIHTMPIIQLIIVSFISPLTIFDVIKFPQRGHHQFRIDWWLIRKLAVRMKFVLHVIDANCSIAQNDGFDERECEIKKKQKKSYWQNSVVECKQELDIYFVFSTSICTKIQPTALNSIRSKPFEHRWRPRAASTLHIIRCSCLFVCIFACAIGTEISHVAIRLHCISIKVFTQFLFVGIYHLPCKTIHSMHLCKKKKTLSVNSITSL